MVKKFAIIKNRRLFYIKGIKAITESGVYSENISRTHLMESL